MLALWLALAFLAGIGGTVLFQYLWSRHRRGILLGKYSDTKKYQVKVGWQLILNTDNLARAKAERTKLKRDKHDAELYVDGVSRG